MLALALTALSAGAADPAKVIRHVFPVAESGFDPAGVQDLYSATSAPAGCRPLHWKVEGDGRPRFVRRCRMAFRHGSRFEMTRRADRG